MEISHRGADPVRVRRRLPTANGGDPATQVAFPRDGSDRPAGSGRTLGIRQAPPAEHPVAVAVNRQDGFVVVRVEGRVDSRAAGPLYDALVGAAGDGTTTLLVDVTGVTGLTRAGIGGLVVAAKLLQSAGGAMRICGAGRTVRLFLEGLGFDHLLKCGSAVAASVADGRDEPAAPAPGGGRRVPLSVWRTRIMSATLESLGAIAPRSRHATPPWSRNISLAWEWCRRRHRIHRDARRLRQMPDHLLKDIGISRSQIDWAVEHGRQARRGPARRAG